MCKVVCAMGFGPIGFMTSCDETSVQICGQSTAESTGCMHVSCVLGVAEAVYILDWACTVFSPEWYMSCEDSSLFPLSTSVRVYVLQRLCDETAVQNTVCISKKNKNKKKNKCLYVSRHAAAYSPGDPLPRCCMTD